MSVEYCAVIVVGLPKDELDLTYEEQEEVGLEFIPRYYDATDGIVGVVVQETTDYSYEPMSDIFTDQVNLAHAAFENATGKVGKLYLSTKGW